MSNQRNVEALKALLATAVLANRSREGDLSFEFLSTWLAAQGVLVPSALSDAEAVDLGYLSDTADDIGSEVKAINVRTRLSLLAKGEAYAS